MKQGEVGSSETAVRLETVYPHAPERVWQALTDPEALRQWLLPGTFQPKLGHRFRFTRRSAGGKRERVDCQVVELEVPRRLAYTWRTDQEATPTLVTWTLEPVEGGTRVCLEHTASETGLTPRAALSDPVQNCLASSLAGRCLQRYPTTLPQYRRVRVAHRRKGVISCAP